MSYKSEVIKRMYGTRNCAIDNSNDLYTDKYIETYGERKPPTSNNYHVWFKVLDDARKIQAVIDALNALSELTLQIQESLL